MKHLYPRHRIDISPSDLFFGIRQCARRPDPQEAGRALAAQLPLGAWIAGLSVRSCFDLLLTTLDLKPGDEVLLSALTIPDMPRIVTAHGLLPVPVDIDPFTLSPTREALEAAWSPRVKVLVVAQLFGGQADFEAAERFCKERGILLVNDNAQGYTGPQSLLDPHGDVAFYSFGSIKTATCLGGALTRVKDREVHHRMRQIQDGWPMQPTTAYARKIAQYTALLALRDPLVYGAFERACEVFSTGLDDVVMSMTRGFPCADTGELLSRLRHRPSGAMLALLSRRLEHFDGERLLLRARAGQSAVHQLAGIEVVGRRQTNRTHWLYAVQLEEPERYIAPLRAAGFDSARGSTSLFALPAPAGRPHPARAHRIMERLLFLPMYPEIPGDERARLARLLQEKIPAQRAVRRPPLNDSPHPG